MSQRLFIVFSFILDALCIIGAMALAYLIRFAGYPPDQNLNALLLATPFMLGSYYLAGWIYGLYEPGSAKTLWGVTRATFLTTAIGALLTALVLFFGGESTASFARWTFVLGTAFIFMFLTIWRFLFIRFGSVVWPTQHILILGTGEMALNLARNLKKYREKHLNLVGFVEMSASDPSPHRDLQKYAPIQGAYSDLSNIITRTKATRLIVAAPARQREVIAMIALVDGSNVIIDIVPDIYEILLASTGSIVGDIPLIQITGKQLSGYGLVPKRIFDLVLGIIFALLGSPIMAAATIAIKLDDGGPVFYLQERVGKGGKLFSVIKFRTMQLDAEKETGPILAEDDDPRITPVGKAIRRLRIDEMPQILNVLSGQMSFIGPRPERPFFVERYRKEIEGYDERQRVLPGITGLAQVNGGYATTPQLKLKYDLMYVYHQSFLLDLQVIAETIKVVLTGRGAR
jgi:exopolysaccharide biosynthesis polyprenyl glycosylphosphotransferase